MIELLLGFSILMIVVAYLVVLVCYILCIVLIPVAVLLLICLIPVSLLFGFSEVIFDILGRVLHWPGKVIRKIKEQQNESI